MNKSKEKREDKSSKLGKQDNVNNVRKSDKESNTNNTKKANKENNTNNVEKIKKENGFSIINFLLIVIVIVAGIFVYDMLSNNVETKTSTANAIVFSNETNIKVNTSKKDNKNNKNNKNENISENESLSDNIIKNSSSITSANANSSNSVNYKKYFYSQINDNAKFMYDGIYKNINVLKDGAGTIEFDINKNGIEDDFQTAWDAINLDNPGIFYIDTKKLSLKTQTITTFFGAKTTYQYILEPAEGNTNYLAKPFNSKEDVENAISKTESIANSVVNNARGSTYDKVKYVHDYVINTTSYDEDNTLNNGNIYGTLVNHKAVCEGYAETIKYLLDKLNIPCVIVYGDGLKEDGSREYHSWNYVKMDNENWYAIDATWDDPIIIGNGTLPESEKYTYFLKGSKSFSSAHIEEKDVSGTGQSFKYPKLSENDF